MTNSTDAMTSSNTQKTTADSAKSLDSTAQTSSGSSIEGEGSAEGNSRFRKMTKSFGNAKDALIGSKVDKK